MVDTALKETILGKLTGETGRPFAVFDFDNTCIVGDIGEAALALLGSPEMVGQYDDLLKSGKIKEAFIFATHVLDGMNGEQTRELVSTIIAGGKLAIRPEIIALMNFLEENDVAIWIISASAEVLVREAAKYFKIPGQVIGLRDGELQPILEGKVDCIRAFIDEERRPLLAVGDSLNDLPMLEIANLKLVVGGDEALLSRTRSPDWFVL